MKTLIKVKYMGAKGIYSDMKIFIDENVPYRYLATLYEVLIREHFDFSVENYKGDES